LKSSKISSLSWSSVLEMQEEAIRPFEIEKSVSYCL
jgi:hypothetical protein